VYNKIHGLFYVSSYSPGSNCDAQGLMYGMVIDAIIMQHQGCTCNAVTALQKQMRLQF